MIPKDKARRFNPALSDVLADDGDPVVVTDSTGRRWKVGYPTQRAKARLEKLVFQEEMALLREQKELGILTETEFEVRAERLAKQAKAKDFAEGKPLWVKHTTQADGAVLWIQSLLMEHQPDVTREQVTALLADRGPEVRAAVEVVVPPFFAWALGLAIPLVDRAVEAKLPGAERAKAELMKLDLTAFAPDRPTPTE